MVRLFVAASAGAALVAAPAVAALVPVPLVVQHTIKQRTSGLGYVPARVPFGFRYARWSYSATPQPVTRIWFRRRLKPASWQITFIAAKQAGPCPRGEKSYQVDGNKVWWSHTRNEQQAWRCVSRPKGSVRLTAATSMPPTAFAAVGLAQVAAAGHRIR
jgi:hypothetical protein